MPELAPKVLSMPASTPHPIPSRVVAARSAAVLGSVLGVGILTAAVIEFTHRPEWRIAWLAALVVSLFAAALSLVPVCAGIFGGPKTAAYGYLAGAAIRLLVSIGGCLLAVFAIGAPARPTLLMAVPLYFVQLIAEPLILRRWMVRRSNQTSFP